MKTFFESIIKNLLLCNNMILKIILILQKSKRKKQRYFNFKKYEKMIINSKNIDNSTKFINGISKI